MTKAYSRMTSPPGSVKRPTSAQSACACSPGRRLEAHRQLFAPGLSQRVDKAPDDDLRARKAHGTDLGKESHRRESVIEKTLPQIILERIELGRSRSGAKRSRHLLANDASDGIAAVAGELRDLAQRTSFFVEESNVHELIPG